MRKWRKEEVQFLRQNYDKMTFAQIATKLNRTRHSVARKLDRLRKEEGLRFKKKPWTQEEIEFLRKNVHKMTNKEIAKRLNRTESAIETAINHLGLSKPRLEELKNLTDFEEGWLSALIDGEGSILFQKDKRPNRRLCYIPEVCIGNTCKDLLKKFVGLVPFAKIYPHNKKFTRATNRKDSYIAVVRGIRKVLPLLKLVQPFLIAKRKQCNLMIKWCELRLSKRWGAPYDSEELKIIEEIYKLNRRGKSNGCSSSTC